ncbi:MULTISPECIES: helix-turn-helix domain-containing protein [unclassified Beijerinckia]|uniref:AraC family transcriptional regulator n=1 Tax=unclassified Beijerinckia TaxID=2638183 RepID=UPI00089743B2|nr:MULTISPECIES: helix-turn-helix domain-containing protein [unclassified Beijerinckia]MDH7795686.1 AraC-like DNA-binding protein [Beijerinckia sp. GAS462]SEC11831.1 AraC-type DNA-binding protein [Beijerinckia sp. 28-YEA-48]
MSALRPSTVRQFDDGVDRWSIVSAPAAKPLSSLVNGYGSYTEKTQSFAARRELASTCGVLIFALDEPLSIVGADGVEIVLKAGEAFVGGAADATSISRALGPQRGLHVFLSAAGLAGICNAPLAEIANRVAPLSAFRGADARELGARLGEARTAEEQFDLADQAFTRWFADSRSFDKTVQWAMAQFCDAEPAAVADVAREIGWSRKHLTQRFTTLTGHSPQTYRRLARFARFTARLMRRPGDSLAELAAETGYYDQSHLSRDVQALSAMTPGELRASLLPGLGGFRED